MEKDKQMLILVDDDGKKTGHARRDECHKGKGLRHLAFVVLLTSQKEFLIQKRKHELFDGLWDVSCTSHPMVVERDVAFGRIYEDETLEEAAEKCMQRELGITSSLRKIGHFNYFADHGENCENEHCIIFVGKLAEDPKPNLDEIYELRWISLAELAEEIESDPDKFTPWLKHSVDVMTKNLSHL